MEGTILTLALSLIRAVVKNPRKKEKLKKIMLEIRDAIDAAFATDVNT
jgi:dihydroxyacetone kinase-like predicted kinase